MNLAFRSKVELFKQGHFDKIPLHIDKEIGVFYFSPKQLEALKLFTSGNVDFVGYGGGAFGGKTALECYIPILAGFAYPGIASGIGRKTITVLNQTVLETIFKIMAGEGLEEGIDYKYRGGSTNRLWLRTHKDWKMCSSIFFLHMAYKPTDPLYTRFGGLELTWAFVDESNEIDYQAIGILNTRLGRRKNLDYGLHGCLMETFNPDKGHVYRRYYKPWAKGEEKERRKFIRALPRDNPHPSVESYIERIVSEGDLVTTQRLIHGNFDYDDDPRLLVDQGAVNDMFNNTFIKPGERRIIVDVAGQGRDETVARVFFGLVCVDRISEKKSDKSSVLRIIADLKNKHRVSDRNIVIDGNGVGAEVCDAMPMTVRFIAQKRPFNSYQNGNFATLKDQCGYLLAEKINENKIWDKVESSAEEITTQFSALKRVETGDKPKKIIPKDEMKELLGKSPDDLDCFIMLMLLELKPDYSARKWN